MIRGITHILNTDTGFRDAAGLNKAGTKYKAYPVTVGQQEEAPYSAVRLVSMRPVPCGFGRPTSFTATIAIASYHKNFEDCEALAKATRDALDMKEGTYNTVKFKLIRFDNEQDGDYESERELFVRIQEYVATINEDPTT